MEKFDAGTLARLLELLAGAQRGGAPKDVP